MKKQFTIEFWFRRNDEKDFDTETIEADSYGQAVELLKSKYPSIHIFKTNMIPCSTL